MFDRLHMGWKLWWFVNTMTMAMIRCWNNNSTGKLHGSHPQNNRVEKEFKEQFEERKVDVKEDMKTLTKANKDDD